MTPEKTYILRLTEQESTIENELKAISAEIKNTRSELKGVSDVTTRLLINQAKSAAAAKAPESAPVPAPDAPPTESGDTSDLVARTVLKTFEALRKPENAHILKAVALAPEAPLERELPPFKQWRSPAISVEVAQLLKPITNEAERGRAAAAFLSTKGYRHHNELLGLASLLIAERSMALIDAGEKEYAKRLDQFQKPDKADLIMLILEHTTDELYRVTDAGFDTIEAIQILDKIRRNEDFSRKGSITFEQFYTAEDFDFSNVAMFGLAYLMRKENITQRLKPVLFDLASTARILYYRGFKPKSDRGRDFIYIIGKRLLLSEQRQAGDGVGLQTPTPSSNPHLNCLGPLDHDAPHPAQHYPSQT